MWFISSNNQQTGPFDERDIAVGLAQGLYNAHTMVWREGWPQWAQLAHSELAKYLPKVPMPKVPMPPMPMPIPASAPMYATASSLVSVRDRIFGGIGLVWGSIALVNGVLTGIRSLTGFLFSLLMILVGGYYFFGKPKKYFAFMGIAAIGLIFFAVAKFPNRSATEATNASVGDTFRTEKFEITITSAGERSSVGSEFFVQQPSTGATFVAVQATIKNISSRPINSFSMPDIHLMAPDGIRFDPDIGASSSFATELDLDEKVFSDLNPGITVRSGNVFEVAKDQFDKTTWRLFVDADESVYVTFEPAARSAAMSPAPDTTPKIVQSETPKTVPTQVRSGRVANFSYGEPGTKDFEELSFWVWEGKQLDINYMYGKDWNEVKLEYLGPGQEDNQGSFNVRFPNEYILTVRPETAGLLVQDKNKKYSKNFNWYYEGPVDGRGTFCNACVESEEATDFVNKYFLQKPASDVAIETAAAPDDSRRSAF